MARVKRAVNAQKKRRTTLERASGLPRSAFAPVPEGEGAGHPLPRLLVPRPQGAQAGLPQAVDPAHQRCVPRAGPDLQPPDPGPQGSRASRWTAACWPTSPSTTPRRSTRSWPPPRPPCPRTSTRRRLRDPRSLLSPTARPASPRSRAAGRCTRSPRSRTRLDGGFAVPRHDVPVADEILTNPRAERVKAVRALSGRSVRKRAGRFVVEGPQAVREAVLARADVHDVYVDGGRRRSGTRRSSTRAARPGHPGARRHGRGARRDEPGRAARRRGRVAHRRTRWRTSSAARAGRGAGERAGPRERRHGHPRRRRGRRRRRACSPPRASTCTTRRSSGPRPGRCSTCRSSRARTWRTRSPRCAPPG